MAVIVDVQQVYLGTVPETQLIQHWAESALQKVAEDWLMKLKVLT